MLHFRSIIEIIRLIIQLMLENEEGDKKCSRCNGEGVYFVDVFDPDSGQMMRGVGTEECSCDGKRQVAEGEMDDDSKI
tara:strand:+ start:3280 stop:3513 length:234 start_codon:yes stop_codon:yes gene_type:complete